MGQHDSYDMNREINIQMSVHKYLEKIGVFKASQIIINSPEMVGSQLKQLSDLDVIIK